MYIKKQQKGKTDEILKASARYLLFALAFALVLQLCTCENAFVFSRSEARNFFYVLKSSQWTINDCFRVERGLCEVGARSLKAWLLSAKQRNLNVYKLDKTTLFQASTSASVRRLLF